MATKATRNDYWIATNAISITLNAMGDTEKILASVSAGSVIMCFMAGITGLEYDNGHNYKRWTLRAYPTVFSTQTEKYVYVAIPRPEGAVSEGYTVESDQDHALLCFPSAEIDLYGEQIDSDGNVVYEPEYEEDGETPKKDDDGNIIYSDTPVQVGSGAYYYIDLQGRITASTGGNREWSNDVVTGNLNTDEAINSGGSGQWYEYSTVTGLVTFLKDITFKIKDEASNAYFHFINFFAKIANISDRLTISGENLEADTKALTVVKNGASIRGAVVIDGDLSLVGNQTVTGCATFGTEKDPTMSVGKTDGNVDFGTFEQGLAGGRIDKDGVAELDSLTLRTELVVPKITYNCEQWIGGNSWRSQGGGTIKKVVTADDGTHYAMLDIKAGEGGKVAADDKCQGIFHLTSGNETEDKDETAIVTWTGTDPDTGEEVPHTSKEKIHTGHFTFKGFKTIYFRITEVFGSDTSDDEKKILYNAFGAETDDAKAEIDELLSMNGIVQFVTRSESKEYDDDGNLISGGYGDWEDSTLPQPQMDFAAYANRTDSNRQEVTLSTPKYEVGLGDMTDWTYKPSNILYVARNLNGFCVDKRYWNKDKEGGAGWEYGIKYFSGYGIAIGNLYMWGNIDEFERAPSLVSQQLYRKAFVGTEYTDKPTTDDIGTSTETKATAEKPYLWGYWLYSYSDGNTSKSDVFLAANYAESGDVVQTNLYGYDCKLHSTNNDTVVHTKAGFAGMMQGYVDGEGTEYHYMQIYHEKAGGGGYPIDSKKKYAISGKLKVTNVSGMPSGFTIQVGFDSCASTWVKENAVYDQEYEFSMKAGRADSSSATSACPWVIINGNDAITSSVKALIEVTDWKFEDATDLNGTSTPFDGLAADSIPQGQNLLLNAGDFAKNWTQGTGVCGAALTLVVNAYQGNTAVYYSYKDGKYYDDDDNRYHTVAKQEITGKLKGGTWYSFSWWEKGNGYINSWVRNMPTESQHSLIVCDEEEARTYDNPAPVQSCHYGHNVTSEWTRHTMKFRTPYTLGSSDYLVIDWTVEADHNTSDYEYYICMPKLEECEKATAWQLAEADRKGAAGADAVTCDLTNEMDSVACDYEGVPVSGGESKSTTVELWNGSVKDTSVYVILLNGKEISNGASEWTIYYDGEHDVPGIKASRSGNTLTFTMTDKSAADSTSLTISATSANNSSVTGTCTFTLTKTKAGGKGANAIIYQLAPSENAIQVGSDGNKKTTSLTCGVTKVDGETVTNLTALPDGYKLYEEKDGNDTLTDIALDGESTYLASATTKVTFYLKKDDTVVDKEAVPVVADGEKGQDGAQPNLLDGSKKYTETNKFAWSSVKEDGYVYLTDVNAAFDGTSRTLTISACTDCEIANAHGGDVNTGKVTLFLRLYDVDDKETYLCFNTTTYGYKSLGNNRYSWTFELPNGTMRADVRVNNYSDGTEEQTSHWWNFKLEEGSEATAWCMSENDKKGLSAYEVAVAEGYKGTEADWLKSLMGATGKSVKTITEYYAINADKNSHPEIPSDFPISLGDWSTKNNPPTNENPYLWNFEVSCDDDGKVIATTTPVVIGNYAEGVTGVNEQYLAYATEQSSISPETEGKSTIGETGFGKDKPYLYNREQTKLASGGYGDWDDWQLISYYGQNGADGVQSNLFGYDNYISNYRLAVHTKTGFATVIEATDSNTIYHEIRSGSSSSSVFAVGVYALSCKVKFTAIQNSMPSTFKACCTFQEGELKSGSIKPYNAKGEEVDSIVCGTEYYFRIKWDLTTARYPYIYIQGLSSGNKCLMEVSDLKIEDASALTGTYTAFNGLAEDSIKQGNNLLTDASELNESWDLYGSRNGNGYDSNYQAYRKPLSSDDASIIQQSVSLQSGKWYTLSWYAKADKSGMTCQMNIDNAIIDPSANIVVCDEDGVKFLADGSTPYNSHTLTTNWVRHTLTFRVSSSGTFDIRWLLPNQSAYTSYNVYISTPKLEECEKATDWCLDTSEENAVTFAHQMRKRGTWSASGTYYNNKAYIDVVLYNDVYYAVRDGIGSVSSSTSPDKDTGNWQKADMFGFVATDLFLAAKAYIENLALNYAAAYPMKDGALDIANPTIQIAGDTGILTAHGLVADSAEIQGVIKASAIYHSIEDAGVGAITTDKSLDPETDGKSVYLVRFDCTVTLPYSSKKEGLTITLANTDANDTSWVSVKSNSGIICYGTQQYTTLTYRFGTVTFMVIGGGWYVVSTTCSSSNIGGTTV